MVGEGKVILCKLDQGWVVEEGIVEGGVWGRGDVGGVQYDDGNPGMWVIF